jgi:hypothetical protein
MDDIRGEPVRNWPDSQASALQTRCRRVVGMVRGTVAGPPAGGRV